MKSKADGRTVKVDQGGLEKAMRKFKKKISNSGILQEVRERREYEKPSTVRRKAKLRAVRRHQKNLLKNSENIKRLY